MTNLERHENDFEDADAIPVSWLPMTAGPWIGMALASALVIAGLTILWRPGLGPLIAIAAIALASVVGPFVARFPQKASAADDLLDSLTVTPDIAAHTRDVLDGARAAAEELEAKVYPDLAEALGMSAAELDAAIADQFPAVARGRAEFEAVLERYERRVQIREAGLSVVPEAKTFPLEAATWWAVVPGALTALAAAVAIAPPRRRGSLRAENPC